MPSRSSRAFTLIELLATIAVIAVLVVGVLFFTVSYVQNARQTADRQTLTILNDALTRYKCEGGSVTSLTSGADIGRVLSALQSAITWGGRSHQVLRSALTYPARSLSASGDHAQYHFDRYNTYLAETLSGVGGGGTWYSVSNTGGPTGTIVFNLTVEGSDLGDPMQVYAIANGTESFDDSSSDYAYWWGPAWPDAPVWQAEAAKNWHGSSTSPQGVSVGGPIVYTIDSLPPGTYTLQYWDVGSGEPPYYNYWPWLIPGSTRSITVGAGQTATVSGTMSTVNPPINNFYNYYMIWN